MSAFISLANISWSTPDRRAVLSDISLTFQRERAGIVGRNGAGKSTLLKLVSGSLAPMRGHVLVEGTIGVLRQMAGLVRNFVRGEDIAARIGGEEFAVLLPESDLEAARAFADRLREAVAAASFELGGEDRRLTISIGVAGLAEGRRERSALMQAADAALYRAKEEGRNRVCVEA